MATATAVQTPAGKKPALEPRVAAMFGVRISGALLGRLDEARWRLRISSRNRAVETAIREWLERNGI